MTFNSVVFIVFLPITLTIYWLVAAPYRRHVLVVASYGFYAAWDVRLLPLLMVSTVVDFIVSNRMAGIEAPNTRKRWLRVSLAVNLGLLATFKYFGFFVESAGDLLETVGFDPNLPVLNIVLPVGISFYTFQTMGYTIDVFRRRIQPVTDLVTFAAFVAFFPQLVAGPIERAEQLLPQLENPRALSAVRFEQAVRLFVRGLVLKVAIADTAAPIVADGFDTFGSGGSANAGVAIVAFSVQIYGDFAGYTAMARGVAMLFGVDLVPNFAEPYLSTSITEFWRRWHMSLSQWLRDYLYIPLGGNRGTPTRTRFNLMAVMALGGLWHGAGWHFVFWGLWHGLWLMLERGQARSIDAVPGARDIVHVVRTLLVVMVGWVFFRVESMATIGDFITSLGSASTTPGPASTVIVNVVLLCAALLWLDVTNRRRTGVETEPTTLASGLALGAAAVALVITAGSPTSPFIYFQF